MQRDCGRRLSNTNAGSTSGSHRYSSLSLLIVDIMIAAILFVKVGRCSGAPKDDDFRPPPEGLAV